MKRRDSVTSMGLFLSFSLFTIFCYFIIFITLHYWYYYCCYSYYCYCYCCHFYCDFTVLIGAATITIIIIIITVAIVIIDTVTFIFIFVTDSSITISAIHTFRNNFNFVILNLCQFRSFNFFPLLFLYLFHSFLTLFSPYFFSLSSQRFTLYRTLI